MRSGQKKLEMQARARARAKARARDNWTGPLLW